MKGSKDLDLVDRATLRVWRFTNIVGWGFLAVVVGVALGWLAQNASYATAGRLGGSLAAIVVMVALYLALVGAAVGAIVGLHVYRAPGVVAGVAAFVAYGAFPQIGTLDALRFGLADVGAPIVFGLIEIAAAVFASRVLWKRRPAALRGR